MARLAVIPGLMQYVAGLFAAAGIYSASQAHHTVRRRLAWSAVLMTDARAQRVEREP
jgi:hypothetical protein